MAWHDAAGLRHSTTRDNKAWRHRTWNGATRKETYDKNMTKRNMICGEKWYSAAATALHSLLTVLGVVLRVLEKLGNAPKARPVCFLTLNWLNACVFNVFCRFSRWRKVEKNSWKWEDARQPTHRTKRTQPPRQEADTDVQPESLGREDQLWRADQEQDDSEGATGNQTDG